MVTHVDDLLMAGSRVAEDSLMKVGAELGFGSVERDDFHWCGKRIRRAPDKRFACPWRSTIKTFVR